MNSLEYLYRLLSEYQEFKSSLEGVLRNVKGSLEPLYMASKNIQEVFLYDEYGADDGKIAKNKANIDNLVNLLEQDIMPEVNRKIAIINRQIADAQMAQALNASM